MENNALIEKLKEDKEHVDVLMTTAGLMNVHKIEEVTDSIIIMWIMVYDETKKPLLNKTIIQTKILLGYGVQGKLAFEGNIKNIKKI